MIANLVVGGCDETGGILGGRHDTLWNGVDFGRSSEQRFEVAHGNYSD
jgi:hypothetical protein